MFGNVSNKTITNVIPRPTSAATKALIPRVMRGYTLNVGLSATEGTRADLVNDRLFFFRQIATGIVVGSALAATWFHLSNILMSSSSVDGQRFPEILVKHASLIIFQSMFVLAIFVIVGLPIYFLARRIGKVNLSYAIASGFIVGVLVSTLYGGPDFGSLREFVKMASTFGVSGVIAAYAFWYFVRGIRGQARG